MIRPPRLAVLLLALLAWLSACVASDPLVQLNARVVDSVARTPIADAILTAGDREIRSDLHGFFVLAALDTGVIRVRAHGYLRADVAVQALREPEAEISLKPLRPKALYLSVYGIGDRALRTAALKLLDTTELNALAIDLKGDRGIVPIAARSPWPRKSARNA